MFKLVTLVVVAVNRACTNLAVDMESHVDGARGAAARWRHEQQSVAVALAVALAAALHHSSVTSSKKVVERRERQEEEVHETHVAQRGSRTTLPGTRAAGEARGGGLSLVVDGLPTFALPVLVGSGEAIDSGALSFLLKQQLSAMDVVEEEEKEEKEEVKPILESVEWVSSVTPGARQAYSFDLLETSGQHQGRMGRRTECRGGRLRLRPPSSSSCVTGGHGCLRRGHWFSLHVWVSGCCLRRTDTGFCFLLRFRIHCNSWSDIGFLFMRQSAVPALFSTSGHFSTFPCIQHSLVRC